jgi:hypothetical protein
LGKINPPLPIRRNGDTGKSHVTFSGFHRGKHFRNTFIPHKFRGKVIFLANDVGQIDTEAL